MIQKFCFILRKSQTLTENGTIPSAETCNQVLYPPGLDFTFCESDLLDRLNKCVESLLIELHDIHIRFLSFLFFFFSLLCFCFAGSKRTGLSPLSNQCKCLLFLRLVYHKPSGAPWVSSQSKNKRHRPQLTFFEPRANFLRFQYNFFWTTRYIINVRHVVETLS